MINGIQGKPGGGKSYEAVVTHIIPVITRDKRKVVTNLPLNIDHFCNVYGEYCRELIEVIDGQFHNYGGERPFSKKDHYLQYDDWQNEKGQKVYFFIDECHLAMGVGSTEKELKEFFSMHRHYGFDIMLITQNFRKVDRDIRDMIQTGYRAIKKSMLGQDDKYLLKVHDGAGSTASSCVATHERVYEKKYFAFYQSHTKSDTSVQESTSKDIQLWYKHWTIKASILFFILGFLIVGSKFCSLNEKDKQTETKPKITKTEIVPPAGGQPPVELENKKVKPFDLSENEKAYKKLKEESKKYHPFHKVNLSISGFADYFERGKRVKYLHISASQNGQHVFTTSTRDLMMAGYTVRIFSECSAVISFFDYREFLTCNAPTQSVGIVNNVE